MQKGKAIVVLKSNINNNKAPHNLAVLAVFYNWSKDKNHEKLKIKLFKQIF
jgi:3-methyladenine DNA glycosylase AlkC